MRIISFCAEGIKEAEKAGFYQWIAEQDADFICIQDIRCSEYDLHSDVFFPREYNAYFFEAADSSQNGVAIYCRELPKAIMTGLGFLDFDSEGRYIQADYHNFSVGCLLAPCADVGDLASIERKKHFFDQLENHLVKIANKRRDFIFCGNLNMSHTANDVQNVSENLDKPGFLPAEQLWLENLFGKIGYIDAFREVNEDSDEYSWWPNGNREENGKRVDFQIASKGLRSKVEYGVTYKKQVFSNHAPVIMDYDIEL